MELASGQYQLVEFFAYWGLDSRAMAPTMSRLEAEYADRLNFVYLDIDNPSTRDFQRQLGFRYQPHYFLLDASGKIIRQWLGQVTFDEFAVVLDGVLPNPTQTPTRTPLPRP